MNYNKCQVESYNLVVSTPVSSSGGSGFGSQLAD
jgi:hypothetical protein